MIDQPDSFQKKYLHYALFFLLVCFSAYLRILHVNFGLPDHYHPDEVIATAEVGKFLDGDFNLKRYQHPPLFKNIAFLGLKCVNFFVDLKRLNRTSCITLGLRIVSVITGTLAVAALYILSQEFLYPSFSLGVCLLYTVLPVTVFCSKYGTPDAMLSLMFIVAFWFQLQLYKKKSLYLYALNGFVLAIAFSTKYNAVFLFFSFLAAHIFAHKDFLFDWKKLFDPKKITVFIVSVAIGLLIGFPQVPFGGWKYLVSSLIFEKNHLFIKGHYQITISGADYCYVFHFIKSVFPATGILLFGVIICGMGWVLYTKWREPKYAILIIGLISSYIPIEIVYKVPVCYERYIMPLLGLYLLFALIFMDHLFTMISPKFRVNKTILMCVFLLIFGSYPAVKTTKLLATMTPDTRETMRRWMERNLPAYSAVFLQWPRSGYYPDISSIGFRVVSSGLSQNRQSLSSNSADYLLVSSLMYDRYFDYPHEVPPLTSFYEHLFLLKKPLFQVKPSYESYMIHNPTLKIFKNNPGKSRYER